MNLNKLSGWQRLALVVSVIYWVGAATYSVGRGMQAPDKSALPAATDLFPDKSALPAAAAAAAVAAVAATEAATAQAAVSTRASASKGKAPTATPVDYDPFPPVSPTPAPSEGKRPGGAQNDNDQWKPVRTEPIPPAPARTMSRAKPLPTVDELLGPDPTKHQSAEEFLGLDPRRVPKAPARNFAFITFATLMAVALAIYGAAAGLIWAGAGFRRQPVTQE